VASIAQTAPGAAPLKVGKKAAVSLEPLDLTDAPSKGWRRVVWFAETHLVVPHGYGRGLPFKYRPWQRDIIRGLFPMRGDRPSKGLLALPRGNGKSSLSATIALYLLFCEEEWSPVVLLCGADLRSAGIVLNMARRMVELSPGLVARTKVYQDRLYVPGCDGTIQAMPSDVGALQGWRGHAIVDELHVVGPDVWESMLLATGKQENSLTLAISTPALSEESVMWSLVKENREHPDKDFFFREWTSDATHELDCTHCEKTSNPALGDFLSARSMASVRISTRPSEYRRLRLGQWPTKVEDQYLASTDLDAITQPTTVAPGSRVILAVDGSLTGDSTAITLASIESVPYVDLVRIWEPGQEAEGYTVPALDVEDEIRLLCSRYKVEEIVFDPWLYSRTMEVLAGEGLPVVTHPQSRARMGPLTSGFYEAVANRLVTISDNPILRQHYLNARVHETPQGPVLRKASKHSVNRIDSAVSSLMAWGRAVHHANKVQRSRRVVGF
jgi:phage terminase large subunit-like protein